MESNGGGSESNLEALGLCAFLKLVVLKMGSIQGIVIKPLPTLDSDSINDLNLHRFPEQVWLRTLLPWEKPYIQVNLP